MSGSCSPVARWSGYCPICEAPTKFEAWTSWFRDHLVCTGCQSIPRERALMLAIHSTVPNWASLRLHESSPSERGASPKLRRKCKRYVSSHLFPNAPRGTMVGEHRCEDLHAQTFADNSFDLVITQDVMEHVFEPERAVAEIHRTLASEGWYIFTAPVYKERINTERCARRVNGEVVHLTPPEYHGNPIDNAGSLVTFRYGYDIQDLLVSWAQFDVEVRRYRNHTYGIVAEFTEVMICRKR